MNFATAGSYRALSPFIESICVCGVLAWNAQTGQFHSATILPPGWTIAELKLKDCEEAAASTAQLKITQSEVPPPPENQVPVDEQQKASFVHIFWRVGSACALSR